MTSPSGRDALVLARRQVRTAFVIPFDTRKPLDPSGIRIGTPALTTRGMGAAEMQVIADCIADCIWHYEEKKDEISERVLRLTREFPLYQ